MKSDEEFRAEVLFLVGLSVREVAHALKMRAGPVNRMVTQRGLVDLRRSERRLARLLDLEALASERNRGYVLDAAQKSAAYVRAQQDEESRDSTKAERGYRMSLPDLIRSAQSHVPEKVFIPEKGRRSTLIRNSGDCPLELMNSKGILPEWAYLTGLHLREDHRLALAGALQGVDASKDVVDAGAGSVSSVLPDSALDAMQRLTDAASAVKFIFGKGWTKNWAIIENVAIMARTLTETVAASRVAMSLGGGFLVQSLEPAAYIYSLNHAGSDVADRLRFWTAPSQAQKIRAANRELDDA